MSIALHSARLAAMHYLAESSALAFQTALAGDVRRQIRRSTRVSQALVTPWGQWGAATLARFAPPVLTNLAALTRIPKHALARTQAETAI